MPRRKPGLHKDLSEILDGARIPEEARDRRTPGEDPSTHAGRVQQDVRARAADNLVPSDPFSPHPPTHAPGPHQDVRARAADDLVPPGPEYMSPRWVVGDETKARRKKSRGLFGVIKRIGRLMAGSEPEELAAEDRISHVHATEATSPEAEPADSTEPQTPTSETND